MIQVVSHKREVEKATQNTMKKAAMMIGGTVEGHAKELCPVDTGLLRNSITYALGGEPPKTTEYRSNGNDKNGKAVEVQTGQYTGQAQTDEDGQITVYVGTNVQYAPYQELGAPNINLQPKPFLRPAMENFKMEIEQIIRQTFGEMR